MTQQQVRIEMTGHGQGRVFIDDVEVCGVQAVRFEGATRDFNRVHLELAASRVDITGPAAILRNEPEPSMVPGREFSLDEIIEQFQAIRREHGNRMVIVTGLYASYCKSLTVKYFADTPTQGAPDVSCVQIGTDMRCI